MRVIDSRTVPTESNPAVTTNSPLYCESPMSSRTNRSVSGRPVVSLAAVQARAARTWAREPISWPEVPCAATTETIVALVHRPRIVASPSPSLNTRGAPSSTSVPMTDFDWVLRNPSFRRYASVTATSSRAPGVGSTPASTVTGSCSARPRSTPVSVPRNGSGSRAARDPRWRSRAAQAR